jgi:hypothetical protein
MKMSGDLELVLLRYEPLANNPLAMHFFHRSARTGSSGIVDSGSVNPSSSGDGSVG